MLAKNKAKERPKWLFYLLLGVVIIVWGFDPVVNKLQYENYSPLALSIISTLFSSILFFILSIKKLKQINLKFLKIALPIGVLNSVACILQRIGLQLTTPPSYAFLEHLSCAFVPIAIYLFTKKRPTFIQLITIVVCIVGCFLISGLIKGFSSISVGDLLCAIAGAILGFCIALVSIYGKQTDTTLLTFVQMISYFVISVIFAFILNKVKINGVIAEEFRFSFNPIHIIFAIAFGLFSVGLCWLFRNMALCRINPIFVAVVSPFSAIISSAISVMLKMENITVELIIGGVLISVAVIISGIGDNKEMIFKQRRKNHG